MSVDRSDLPRGIRNRNPGNIRIGEQWRGMHEHQSDPDFIVFKEDKWGIRAMYKVLRNYQRVHELDTIREIIHRWAPTNENDTNAYITHVCNVAYVDPDTAIDLSRPQTALLVMKAMIKHENGIQPYTDAEILEGINLA